MVTKLTQKVSFFFFFLSFETGSSNEFKATEQFRSFECEQAVFSHSYSTLWKKLFLGVQTTPIIQMGQTLTNEEGKRISCFPPDFIFKYSFLKNPEHLNAEVTSNSIRKSNYTKNTTSKLG